jgi:hypothetical protein
MTIKTIGFEPAKYKLKVGWIIFSIISESE